VNDTVGRRVAWLRTLRGMSQGELAEKIGRTRGYVGQLETDRTKPSVEVLMALADVLETSTDFLLLRTDDPGIGERYPFATSEDERWQKVEALVEHFGEHLERLEEITERLGRLGGLDRLDRADSRVSAPAESKVIDPVSLVVRLLSRLTPQERDVLLRAAGVITETVEETKAASGE